MLTYIERRGMMRSRGTWCLSYWGSPAVSSAHLNWCHHHGQRTSWLHATSYTGIKKLPSYAVTWHFTKCMRGFIFYISANGNVPFQRRRHDNVTVACLHHLSTVKMAARIIATAATKIKSIFLFYESWLENMKFLTFHRKLVIMFTSSCYITKNVPLFTHLKSLNITVYRQY